MLKQCFTNFIIDFPESLELMFLLFCQWPPYICSLREHADVEGSF